MSIFSAFHKRSTMIQHRCTSCCFRLQVFLSDLHTFIRPSGRAGILPSGLQLHLPYMDAAVVSSANCELLMTSRHAGFWAKTEPLHSEGEREEFVQLKWPSAFSLVACSPEPGWEVASFYIFLDGID